MLFFLKCPSCQNRKGIYDTGEEFISKPNPCPKCGNPLEVSVTESKKGTVVTWVRKCSSCKFSETEVEDLEEKRAEWGKKEQEDKELLEKHRSEFCLSEEEGQQYLSFLANMDQLKNMMDEQKEREEHKDLYDKVAKLKKLTIVELEKLLTKTLAKEDYIKLELSNPEMDQFVIVNFTVRDSKEGRGEYDSQNALKKLINKTLLDINWRLMSDGITYRIGFLQGRLKAYEREEDLVKLVSSKKEKTVIEIEESTVY